MSSVNNLANTDPFGLWMMKPTKPGGQVWYIYNTDFNDDPQVYTESTSLEYLVHNIEDADGTRFTISASDTFKTYISTSTGYQSNQNITDQQEMVRRGYMQNPQDWRNVELTGQFVVFKEADDFITFGFRTGKHTGSGSPIGCTGSSYLVEINMKAGGLIRVRKKSWNTSIHNWLSGLASGFDATKICGWTIKILCYNTQDANNVNVEVWLAKDNDNQFVKVLSGIDTGQLNTDATVCNCTTAGQPLTWGGPFVLLQGNTGTFGFKNMSIREIEGYGATLPPVDPGTGGGGGGGTPVPDPGTGGGGTTGGGGSGSGSGSGGTGGGGGTPVDLTPILATPLTSYVEYGGGPNFSPLEIHTIFAGSAWNTTTPTTASSTPPTAAATSIQTAAPVIANPKSSQMKYHGGEIMSEAVIHFIFWGSAWNTHTGNISKPNIMAAVDKVFKSSYFEGLMQYDSDTWLNLRKPKIGSIVVNTTYTPTGSHGLDEIDYGNVIIDSINRGLVPDHGLPTELAPGEEVPPFDLYFIIGPHGWQTDPDFVESNYFHNVYEFSGDGTAYIYATVPDVDFISGSSTNLSYITYGMFHEIVEALSDPLLHTWYGADPSSTHGDLGEIADICSTEYTINGVVVSGYWSNEDNACIAPTAKPSWISCASGFTYNTTTQLCEKTVTTPDPTPTPPPTNANVIEGNLAVPKTGYTVYGGGKPIWSSMEYWVVFPGVEWNSTYNTLRSDIMDKLRTLFASSYFDGLYQYGKIKRPILKGYVVTDYVLPNNPYHDVDVGNAALDASIRYANVPQPTITKPNIAYIVFPLPTFDYSLPSAGGVHQNWSDVYTGGDQNSTLLLHACWAVTSGGRTAEEIVTSASHELVEVLTDDYDFAGQGFVLKDGTPIHNVTDVYGNEMADACESTDVNVETSIVNGVRVSKYWSDQDGKCIAPTAKPTWISCPTGYTWDNTLQACVKNGVTPPPVPDPVPDPGTNIVTAPPIIANPTVHYTELVLPAPVSPLEFYFIFYSSYFSSGSGKTAKDNLMKNMDTIFKSAYFDGLFQYGLTKRPVLKGSVINTTFKLAKGSTSLEFYHLIQDSQSKNQVPTNRAGSMSSAFVIILPQGYYESAFGTSASGAHGAANYDWWAWVAYPADNNSQSIEEIATHEIVEIVLSNIPTQGYVIKDGTPLQPVIDLYFREICDACEDTLTHRRGTLSGLTVSKYWSDQSGQCEFTTAKPSWISCPTGYTWNNKTQQCEKVVSVPTGIMANTALKTQTQNAITTLINSTYFTGLFQYGFTKKPTLGNFVVNTTASISAIPNKYTKDQITALVNDSVAKNLVPAVSASKKNIAYLVILPPRTGYTTGAIGVQYATTFNPTDTTNIYYQIVATASLNVTFDDFTKTISEALIGIVSQNNPNGGGKGYNIKSGTVLDSKITTNGDLLFGPCRDDVSNNKISGITVAKYWSDQDGACIIPATTANPIPWASCHTGAIFDNATQSCKLQPTPGGGGQTPPGTGGGQGYTVALANASDDDGNVPANAIDGKLDTRWSAFGKGQFLRLDLGTAKKVDKIKIAWYQGDKRSNHFEITTAEVQGGAFTSQLKTDSVKGSTALQEYTISPANPVRYIRIIGHGNTQNDWISISEVEVWGPDVPSTVPGTGSGGDAGSGGVTPGGDSGGGTGTPPVDDTTPVPEFVTAYNFFDTSFSVDFHKIGLCNPVE